MKKIAVIHINGVISASGEESVLTPSKNSQYVLEALHKIQRDKSYAAVVFRLNSPGGTTGMSEEISAMIGQTKLLTVASIADIACSGAYMIASSTDYIFSNASAMTGSIGVIMQIPNVSELANKIGVRLTTIKSGKMKDIGNPVRPMTSEEESYLQAFSQKVHDDFIQHVLAHRSAFRVDAHTELLDGRPILASEAQAAGLIDAIGTFYDALQYVYTYLGVKENQIKIVEFYGHKRGILRRLLSECSLLKALLNPALDSNLSLKL